MLWPERSSHTAPRRPIRKPQWLPIAALAAGRLAPRRTQHSGAGRASADEVPADAPPPGRLPGPPWALQPLSGRHRPVEPADVPRRPHRQPRAVGRLPSPRVKLTNESASRFLPLARRARPRSNAGSLETRPRGPGRSPPAGVGGPSRGQTASRRGRVSLQGSAPPSALRANPSASHYKNYVSPMSLEEP